MTGEQDVIDDLVRSAERIVSSAKETLTLVERVPADEASFAALTPIERVATTAALKQFEQLQDVLNGLFRAVLRHLGVRLKGLYPLDIGDRMEELDIIDDPSRWLAAVKLRNELVHEYPDAPIVRLARLREAVDALPFLFDAAERAARAVARRGLLKDKPS